MLNFGGVIVSTPWIVIFYVRGSRTLGNKNLQQCRARCRIDSESKSLAFILRVCCQLNPRWRFEFFSTSNHSSKKKYAARGKWGRFGWTSCWIQNGSSKFQLAPETTPVLLGYNPWKLISHWEIYIFNTKYIFKCWSFHCHVRFRGLRST